VDTQQIKYNHSDLSIIIPTKDRPDKLNNILYSISLQNIKVGRIIVIESGESTEHIVSQYSEQLPVEYYHCFPPGQIRQKNMGISLLDGRTSLVAFFDDDIILEKNALINIINFLNKNSNNTAGISFNIVNNPPYRFSLIRSMLGMSSYKQGRVLKSGFNITISPVEKNLRTKWLCGGATVWKKDILHKFKTKEIKSRWAASEDLLFSYPIGKQHHLYVCSDARVRHEHVYDHKNEKKHSYYGYTLTLWQLYFVRSHKELSILLFFWMILGQIVGRLLIGFAFFEISKIQFAIGQIKGTAIGIITMLRKNKIEYLLEENDL